MTGTEWLASTDPTPMLNFLGGETSERKLRLFAVACGKSILQLLADDSFRRAVEDAEPLADKLATVTECQEASRLRSDLAQEWSIGQQKETVAPEGHQWAVDDLRASFLCDIFGNPFRPLTFDPSWRTSSVVILAEAIYEHRAFDCLPLLAGALEEIGCRDTELLAHCRWSWPHVRGCWALDLVLGKE